MDLLDPPTLSLGWWNDHHHHHTTNQNIRIIDQTNERKFHPERSEVSPWTIGSFTLNYFDGQILATVVEMFTPIVMAMFSPSWLRKAGFPFRVFFTCIGFYKETKICGSYHPKTRHEWHNGGPVSYGAAPKKPQHDISPSLISFNTHPASSPLKNPPNSSL